MRFEPGQDRVVELVALDGNREVYGFNADQWQALGGTDGKYFQTGLCRTLRSHHRRSTAPADTELIIEIEEDRCIYGEEVTFGGGKVIRDGMGQGQRPAAETADLVITNVIILDHWGIIKADVGIKSGRITGIGKAGNPDIQPGVDIVIGPAPM